MIYRHQFRVPASVERVAEFHAHSASMTAITLPPNVVKVQHTSPVLADGDERDFTMRLGPLPVHWLARSDAVSKVGFTDRQLRMPFTEWVHRHIFRAEDENTMDVMDKITLRLRIHSLWWPVGLGKWLCLPVLFGAWKTERMLS